METIQIRKAVMDDLPAVEAVYAYARAFMARNGNPTQWGNTNPTTLMLTQDIAKGELYVVLNGGAICGAFAFILGEDPTYGYIEGRWHDTRPYGTIHRIAGNGTYKGLLKCCVEYCEKRVDYLRIDTHRDNHIMQHLITKLGFSYCGIIYIANGSPRLAYDRKG